MQGDAARRAWKEARTLKDLGELTARWCEGTLRYVPGDADEPYEETEPIREVLASINRKGLMTTFSQPGVPMAEGSAQRAAVEGYAKEDVARRLGTLALSTDLVMLVFSPGDYESGYQIPITVEEFRPFTWLGAYYGHVELEHYAEDLSPEALKEIVRAWRISIIDPVWGREGYLWEHVAAILEGRSTETRFSVEPYDTGLDNDFGV